MVDVLKRTLDRLRKTLSARAETAYDDREAEGASATDQAYAEGEGHAYGVASDDVRAAEADEE